MVKQYIIVKNTQDFGFWEIDTEKLSANLRKKNFTIPDDSKLEYYDEKYHSIVDYLVDIHKDIHFKEIIPDRKYIFGNSLFCFSCFRKAVILKEDKPCCEKHSGLNFI